jgi:uncharacterized protein involved in type VI secretion and phage assembly
MESYFYLARVSDNKDPDNLHRIQVTKHDSMDTVSSWITYLSPQAGAGNGVFFLPDIGEQVLVLALGERHTTQIVIGTIWSENSVPPATGENSNADMNQDGTNSIQFFKSRSGNMLIFDDTEGAEKIQLITGDSKTRLEFSMAEELAGFTTETDLAVTAKGSLSVSAEEIAMEATKQFNVSCEELQTSASKSCTLSADQDMSLQGSGIALN